MDFAHAKVGPAELPACLSKLLLEYMRRLELTYGAIDMRMTPQGEYVFLEINPAGQWQFIEQQTKQPITKALADELVRRDRPSKSA
jgi:D-alanine-D-alanine ligase-like ATP-grasp enzyme